MKNKLLLNCIGLSIKETEGKDGRKFYQISIDQDGEAGTLPMNEDTYLNIKGVFKRYTPCSLTCEYNDQYRSLRVIGFKQGV